VIRVGITGATGYVGVPLVRALLARGDQVRVFSRDPGRARQALGDVDAVEAYLEAPGAWQQQIAGCDVIVHLAGESIGSGRWTARKKQMIRDSRVESSRHLADAIGMAPEGKRPRALVSASGADFYEFADETFDDDEYDERRSAGDSFLARVCRDWEAEARTAEAHGARVVLMRTGVVLGPGGALDKMTTPFKLFVGGKIGSGRQWFAWIHRDDAVAAYLTAIDDSRLRGPVNLVAPGAVRNAELADALGHVMHRPALLPVPGFALKVAVGELATYLLNGRKVVPRALEAVGFAFKFPTVEPALRASLA
jgi:uncharacterized protein (TIGR01777 family)